MESTASGDGQLVGGTGRTVLVVGQGYVGLPISMRAIDVGYRVIGLDKDERRVERLRSCDSYVEDIPDRRLEAAFASGREELEIELIAQEDPWAGSDPLVGLRIEDPKVLQHKEVSGVNLRTEE